MIQIARLHVITDASLQSRWSHVELARLALEGGAPAIQYRRKDGTKRLRIEEASAIRALCRRRGATLLINDEVDVTLAADADGVHLGEDDLPPALARLWLGPAKIVGGSCDHAEGALARSREGVDYAGIGPVFATRSKADTGPVLGLDGLARAVASSPIPLIAIGGISLANVAAVMATGVHGVAVLGAVCLAQDPAAAVAALQGALLAAGSTARDV